MSAEGATTGAASAEAASAWSDWLDAVERVLESDASTATLPEPGPLPPLPEALARRATAVREGIEARAATLREERGRAAAELARLGGAVGTPFAGATPAPAFLDTTA